MKTNWFKRTLCSILTFVMVLGYVPAAAFASEGDGLCEHHTQHTEACGYSPAVEGYACGHEHTDECYQSVTECVHTHDNCGYVPAVEGHGCDCQPNGSGEIVHTEGCGYVEAVTEIPCSHVCSEESGCVTKVLTCQHQHDSECGYAEAVDASACTFHCEECEKDDVDSILFGASSVVASGTCGINLTWELDDEGVLTISGSGPMDNYDYTDNSSPWKDHRSDINFVRIADGVTNIGDYAFHECSNLSSITIPNSVTDIGVSAFTYCYSISSIIIPDGVACIKIGAFSECSSLGSITIPDSVTCIEDYAFSGCNNLSSIKIPKSVTGIGEGAFKDCSTLISVIVPDGVTSLCYGVFQGCRNLVYISIPDSVTGIDGCAFKNCSRLASIAIPDGVTYIYGSAFEGCTSLENFIIPDGITSIYGSTFKGCSSLSSITVPASVTSIDDYAFENCTSMETIWFTGDAPTFAPDVFATESNAFRGVTATAYYPPNNATWTSEITQNYGGNITWKAATPASEIKASGTCGEKLTWVLDAENTLTISGTGEMDNQYGYLYNCAPWVDYRPVIQKIVLEPGVTSIGQNAFRLCEAVTTVIFGPDIVSIGDRAFTECNSLRSVEIGEHVTSIGNLAFEACEKLTNITIPASVTQIGKSPFFLCHSLKRIEVANDNPAYMSDASIALYTKDRTQLIQFAGGIETDFQIPDGVTSIADGAFGDCTLTGVTIPGSVVSLGEQAFYHCANLTHVTIADGLTTIGTHAFGDCLKLEQITIPSSVTTIGNWAFSHCKQLQSITFVGNAPRFAQATFAGTATTAYYPAGNTTWDNAKQNYGGTVTWQPASNIVDSGTCGTNLTWTLDNKGLLTISGTGDMYDYSQDTTNPAPWTVFSGEIKKLELEDGVTGIGDFAFVSCSELENASFPSTLTRVGEYAFFKLTRPNGDMFFQPFWLDINMTVRQWSQVTLEANNEYFPGWDSTNFVCSSPVTASGMSGDKVFWEVNEDGTMEFFGAGDMYEFGAAPSPYFELPVKNVVIGEGITNIGMCLFELMETHPLAQTLESVTIASSVKRVEGVAFRNCKALKMITFTGDAPSFVGNCFGGVTATAYYPAGNATWTTAVMQNYDGTITWKAYCPGHVFGDWVTEGKTSSRACTLCGYAEHRVTTDNGDVEIGIPDQPDLNVEVNPVLPSEDNYILVEEALNNAGDQEQAILKVFDINLKNDDGVHVQPDGSVKVKLPLDWDKDGNYKVYRINDDGTKTDMNAERQGSHMVFETDHFSLYVIVAAKAGKRLNLTGSDLAGKSAVYIDGIAYPVLTAADGSAYVELPENAPPVVVTYSYHNDAGDDSHTQYPTGMQVYRIRQTAAGVTVERIPELDNLLQYSGSSIRIVGNKGIRMITSVNQNTRNALTGNGLAGFKLLEYGTLLAQTSKLGNNPLVLGGGDYVRTNYAYKKDVADPVFKYADGLIQYTNVLVGFNDDQCAEDIAMRPYMKLQDEKGEEFVIYGGIVYRSIGYIAYQNRAAFPVGSAAYEYVWSIIHNVYGNQYDSEYKKQGGYK